MVKLITVEPYNNLIRISKLKGQLAAKEPNKPLIRRENDLVRALKASSVEIRLY